MFFRDYYFSSGNSRVNRLIALFRCIVGLMKQIGFFRISQFITDGICSNKAQSTRKIKLFLVV